MKRTSPGKDVIELSPKEMTEAQERAEALKADPIRLDLSYVGDGNTKVEHYQVEIPRRSVTDVRLLFHYIELWNGVSWLGHKMLKYPTDMWVYQEIMTEYRFDLIVECGTFTGGSALYMATIWDLLGHGEVVTIDIEDQTKGQRPQHGRLSYWMGSSTSPEIVADVKKVAKGKKVLLVLDSDHRALHVLAELKAYAGLSAYIIVEDTNVNGHPVRPGFGPGPLEAVQEFLALGAGDAAWERDIIRERFLLSANPGGYLRLKRK